MFIRIYSGILFSALISITSSYAAYTYVNHIRAANYTLALFSGTLQLITEGVERHEGDKREQWISLVERLIGLPITLVPVDKAQLSPRQLNILANDGKLIERIKHNDTSRLWTLGPDSQFIRIELKNIAEQQLRITAFLILNELGRYPQKKQSEQIGRLKQYFSYDLKVLELKQLALDSQQVNRVVKGDVVVSLQKDSENNDVLMMYSRFKGSNRYLVAGPISIFNPSPTWLLATLLSLALSVTGIVVYFLVRRLEKRIESVSETVLNFGPNTLDSRVSVVGEDAIGDLARGINIMAVRIQNLVKDQKDITQAISHELRTPIARMKFRIEVLNNQVEEAQRLKLNKLNKDISELDSLVEELLLFQMLDSSQNTISDRVNLVSLVQSTVEEIYEPFESTQLILKLCDTSVVIKGNEGHLRRMIQNLLINAFKHAKECVRIEVLSDPTRIIVSDDGVGIPRDERERIFSSFVRLDSSRSRQTGGFGLGLAIIDRIVRIHGAKIAVEDSDLGGAKFEIAFPSFLTRKSGR